MRFNRSALREGTIKRKDLIINGLFIAGSVILFPPVLEVFLRLVDPGVSLVLREGENVVSYRKNARAILAGDEVRVLYQTDDRGFRVCPGLHAEKRKPVAADASVLILGDGNADGAFVSCEHTIASIVERESRYRAVSGALIGGNLKSIFARWKESQRAYKKAHLVILISDSMVLRSIEERSASRKDIWFDHSPIKDLAIYRNLYDTLRTTALSAHIAKPPERWFLKPGFFGESYSRSFFPQKESWPVAPFRIKMEELSEETLAQTFQEVSIFLQQMRKRRTTGRILLVYVPDPQRLFRQDATDRRLDRPMSLREVRNRNSVYNKLLEISKDQSIRLIDGQALLSHRPLRAYHYERMALQKDPNQQGKRAWLSSEGHARLAKQILLYL